MRRLTIFVVVVALIYSAYWFAGARAVNQTLTAQLEQLRTSGWDVGYDDLTVRGFPSRFDTTVSNLNLVSQDDSVGYSALFLQAFALSYHPNRAIVAFPDEQTVRFADDDLLVRSEGLRASVGLNTNTALSLDAATVEAGDVALISDTLGTLSFSDLLGAIRESGPLPHSYDVYLNAQNIAPPAGLIAGLTANSNLPPTLEVVTADATVTIDKPLNRHTLPTWETDPGKLRGLAIRTLTIRWGDLAITGEGELTVDETGTPDGTLTLRATEWQAMLDIAFDAGLLPQDWRFMASSMGQTLSEGQSDLTLPIRFRNGNMSVGPIPVGPAPKLF